MKIYWKSSSVGAELIQEPEHDGKPEKVLGAVIIAHGYAFPWAYNKRDSKIFLPSLFSEKIEEGKKSVITYLQHIGVLSPAKTTPMAHEKAA